jgi:hypothetical protein
MRKKRRRGKKRRGKRRRGGRGIGDDNETDVHSVRWTR